MSSVVGSAFRRGRSCSCGSSHLHHLHQGVRDGNDPLPLWNLVTLVRVHRKLRKWDDDEFRRTEGEHRRIADREVEKLGNRAREKNWGKRRLQQEAERVLERLCNVTEKPKRSDVVPAVRRALTGAEHSRATNGSS